MQCMNKKHNQSRSVTDWDVIASKHPDDLSWLKTNILYRHCLEQYFTTQIYLYERVIERGREKWCIVSRLNEFAMVFVLRRQNVRLRLPRKCVEYKAKHSRKLRINWPLSHTHRCFGTTAIKASKSLLYRLHAISAPSCSVRKTRSLL